MKLPRFGGHLEAFARGVLNGQDTYPVCAGVPAPDGQVVRAGRDPADLARAFEPSSQAIRNWVAQADRQEGRREGKPAAVADSPLSTAEREELAQLRRENKQLRLERDILSRAAAWFARETGAVPSGSSGS